MGACILGYVLVHSYARRQVHAQLVQLNGGPVKISRVSLGLRGLTIHNVQLIEPKSRPASCWCSIERVWMDLTPWDGLRGRTTSKTMTLHQPQVHLRVSSNGTLLTRFRDSVGGFEPPAQEIKLQDGSMTVEPTGRDSIIVRGIQARARQNGTSVSIEGEAKRLLGSAWQFSGAINSATFATTASISSTELVISEEDIARLPLPNPLAHPTGKFSVTGAPHVEFHWDSNELDYRATFVPKLASVTLPGGRVETRIAGGKILVTVDELSVEDLQGALFGGSYKATGTFDRKRQDGFLRTTFNEIRSVDLPSNLDLLDDVTGTVAGGAELTAIYSDSKQWRIHGKVDAVATDVSAFGISFDPVTANVQFQAFSSLESMSQSSVKGMAQIHAEANKIDVQELTNVMGVLQTRWQRSITAGPKPATITASDVDGTLSIHADVEIPLETMLELETFRATGTVASESLAVHGVALRNMTAEVGVLDQAVTLTNATAVVMGPNGQEIGRLAGNADLNRSGTRAIEVSATVTHLSVPAVRELAARRFSIPIPAIHGSLDGSLRATAPIDAASQIDAWAVTGELTSASIRLADADIRDARLSYKLNQGRLDIDKADATIFDSPLRGRGALKVESPYQFAALGTITDFNLANLADRMRPILPTTTTARGMGTVTGKVHGQLAPLSWKASGSGDIRAAAIGDVDLADAHFDWQLDTNRGRVLDFRTKLLGGDLHLDATYPLAGEGDSELHASCKRLDLETLTRLVNPSIPKVKGQLSGQIDVSRWDQPSHVVGKIQLHSNQMVLPQAELQQAQAQVDVDQGTARIHANANLLGGRIDLSGESSWSTLWNSWSQVETSIAEEKPSNGSKNEAMTTYFDGSLALQHFPLAHLLMKVPSAELLQPLSGVVDAKMKVAVNSSFAPLADGRVVVRNLRWLRHEWSRELGGRLSVSANGVKLDQLEGDFAGGRLRASTEIGLGKNLSGRFRGTLEGVQASRMLLPIPALAQHTQGALDVQVHGLIADQWNGHGIVSMKQASVLELPITSVKMPIEFKFTPARSQLQLQSPNLVAQVAKGQVAGRLDINWRRQLDFTTRLRARDIELRSLLRHMPGISRAGTGRVSGTAQFGGRRIRSVNDLSGRFEADLTRLQALQLPVLRQLTRFMGPIQPTTTFDRGNAKGRLANGTIHLEKTTIDGGIAQILVEGTTTLKGKLDLDVTAKTGDLSNAPAGLLQLVRSPLALAAPLPVSLLSDANEFLADRLVYLHVGGTVERPVVRVQPARQLQQEGVQFFLRRGINAVVRNQSQ